MLSGCNRGRTAWTRWSWERGKHRLHRFTFTRSVTKVTLWESYERRAERAALIMANNNWAVWLTEQGGEIFLGLAPTSTRVGRRRFCVLGGFQSDGPNGVGIWMDVDLVQEI